MENQAYIFLGFTLNSISFDKNQTEELVEIRISVSSHDYDEERKVFSLGINVELDYELSKNNVFKYIAGYKVNDGEAEEHLKTDVNMTEYISIFLSMVIPFIRVNIVSITADAGMTVMLPTIDCRSISLDKTLVLTIDK